MTTVRRRVARTDSGELSDASPIRSPNTTGTAAESDYDSARSESDLSEHGENGEAQRKIDHDEDRSNPQYIPKRGTFYEHDDRTAASGEEPVGPGEAPPAGEGRGDETPSERRARPRKSNACDKWAHDKFNENEQTPKSRDELIATYGYDIRNEDAPPHARRNRRYGRGPNKYTRTWEDEEAYRRQAQATAHRKPQATPTPQDFPLLEETRRPPGNKPRDKPAAVRPPRTPPATENGPTVPAGAMPRPSEKRNGAPSKGPRPPQGEKPDKVPMVNLTITTANTSDSSPPQRKVNASVHAQQRPTPSAKPDAPPGRALDAPHTQHPPPAERERHQAAQQQKPAAPQQQSAPVANKTQPPQPVQQPAVAQQQPVPLGENRAGSKRYSSLRQRPLTEPYTPAATPPVVPQQAQTLPQTQNIPPQQLPPQQLPQQQLPQQQLPQQQLPQQQLPPQQLPQQQLPQQQLTPQQLPPQQLPQQQQLSQQMQHRYVPEFQPSQQGPHQGSPGPQMHQPQQMLHQVHRNAQVNQPPHGPSPPHQAVPQQQHPQQVRLGILEQQQLVSHQHALHNISAPHTMTGQMPPAQGYAPPAMMPAQYMQGGNNAVYTGAPVYAPPPPAPYPHQLYQHHNYTHQASGGGVTYYSPVEQEQPAPAPRTQRRPTAAIPIVPPPPHVKSGSNSSEKDSIDRVVDNMFVRKQRPAAHAPAPDKADSSPSNSLTSSSISTDSRPSTERQDSKDLSSESLLPPEPKPEEPRPSEQPAEVPADPEPPTENPEPSKDTLEVSKAVEELKIQDEVKTEVAPEGTVTTEA